MKEGDIVLADLWTSDGIVKKRPALILKVLPKYGDLLLCGISSQTKQLIPDFDLLIDNNSPDYRISGLAKASVIRLSYIAVLPISNIEGKLGVITSENHNKLLIRLCKFLMN